MSRLISRSVTGAVQKDFMGDGKLGPMGVEQRVFRVWVMEVPEG